MRVAILSDIHGNLISLEAVLTDLERQKIDQIVCLGDVATLGPQPKETVARLRQLDATFIMGNHDTYLIDPAKAKQYVDAPWFLNKVNWCIEQLSDDDLDFVKQFLPYTKISLPSKIEMLCYHGSPDSNTDILLPMTPPTTVDTMLGGYRCHIMVGGHTHIQMMRQHKGTLLLNAGSVGMPFEQALFIHAPRLLPWAEYLIVNAEPQGVSADLRRVKIDLDQVRQTARESTMPEKDIWAQNWMDPDGIS